MAESHFTNNRNNLSYQDVLDNLAKKGISIRVASPKLVMEEAPESYKGTLLPFFCFFPSSLPLSSPLLSSPLLFFCSHFCSDVTQVVDTCHQAGFSNKCFKLRPIAVIKG